MIYRELPRENWGRIPPEATAPYAIPEHSRAFVALDGEGKVVAVWCLILAAHAEPLWIREDYRNHPAIIPRLWKTLARAARGAGLHHLVSAILDERPVTRKIAEWVGALPVAGKLYMVPLRDVLSSRSEEAV